MTLNLQDAQTLTYLACRLRQETYGCANWDQAGTFSVIRELIGQNYAETLHRVVGHAMDPEAKTPGAIKRPFVPKRPDEPGRRQPAKAGEDCKRHPGEYVGSCRACAVDALGTPDDPELDDQDRSAGRALLAEIRQRRLIVSGESLARELADEVLPDRPETACSVEGCYRPTRQGICDRCRAQALADDVNAGNAELIERLQANERARAHTRPEPEPGPPRYFTSADIDLDRVHAAMTRAGSTHQEET